MAGPAPELAAGPDWRSAARRTSSMLHPVPVLLPGAGAAVPSFERCPMSRLRFAAASLLLLVSATADAMAQAAPAPAASRPAARTGAMTSRSCAQIRAATAARPRPRAVKGATVEGITEYSLPNGLRVLLFPDPSKPTVTVNITYLVGSRHESYGETGMAH